MVGLPITPTFAASSTLSVSSASGNPGDIIDIAVNIENNPGISAFTLKLDFDKARLTPVSVTRGDVVASGDVTSNMDNTSDYESLNFISVLWVNTADVKTDGVLFSVKFKIKDNAYGQAALTLPYEIGDTTNQNFDDIPFDIVNGTVSITAPIETSHEEPTGGVEPTPEPSEMSPEPIVTSDPTVVEPKNSASRFIDIDDYSWAADAINTLVDKGIVKGTSENTFSPSNNITRADFMILLVRMMGLDAEVTENFSDVASDSYYYHEIGVAKALKLTSGVGDNSFMPEDNITRQDMFVLADRIMKQQGAITEDEGLEILASFTDNALIADYAKPSMATLIKNALVKGDNNKINPLNKATRAETAVFISRTYDFLFLTLGLTRS